MRKSPPNPVGGDNSAGPWQRTGAIDEGSPAYPHNTLEEHFNRDGGLESLVAKPLTMRRQEEKR